MFHASRTSAIDSLQALGLLTRDEQRQAVAHPRLGELSDRPTLEDALAWLLRAEVMDAVSLLDAAKWTGLNLDPVARQARLDLVEPVIAEVSQDSIDALLAGGLVSRPVHQALGALERDGILLTPTAAMLLALRTGLLPPASYKALQASPDKQRTAAANAILAETDASLAQDKAEARRAMLARLLPGPRWLWIAGVPLAIGAIWLFNVAEERFPALAPEPVADAIPACNSSEASLTIFQIVMESDSSLVALGAAGNPTVSAQREIGYNKLRQQRGCMAQVRVLGKETPFAFIIGPSADGGAGRFTLSSAQEEIVQARFGALDAQGDFVHKAEPIGRASLEQAVRAGVAALAEQQLDELTNNVRRLRQEATLRGTTRAREMEIEPLGACRALKEGASYACPLLIEWETPALTLTGAFYKQMLRGEFTIERGEDKDGAAQPWSVSAGFGNEIKRASLTAYEQNKTENTPQAGP